MCHGECMLGVGAHVDCFVGGPNWCLLIRDRFSAYELLKTVDFYADRLQRTVSFLLLKPKASAVMDMFFQDMQ